MKREELESLMRKHIAYAIKDIIHITKDKSEEEYVGSCGYCSAMTRKREYLTMYCLFRFSAEDLVAHMQSVEQSITLDVLNGKYDNYETDVDVTGFL